jgi:hypothetical protein
MLSNLLYTAVQYDSLNEVLGALTAVIHRWQTHYTSQTEQYPHLIPFIQPWQDCLQGTAALLAEMQVQVKP